MGDIRRIHRQYPHSVEISAGCQYVNRPGGGEFRLGADEILDLESGVIQATIGLGELRPADGRLVGANIWAPAHAECRWANRDGCGEPERPTGGGLRGAKYLKTDLVPVNMFPMGVRPNQAPITNRRYCRGATSNHNAQNRRLERTNDGAKRNRRKSGAPKGEASNATNPEASDGAARQYWLRTFTPRAHRGRRGRNSSVRGIAVSIIASRRR